jgi:hypothetical protein
VAQTWPDVAPLRHKLGRRVPSPPVSRHAMPMAVVSLLCDRPLLTVRTARRRCYGHAEARSAKTKLVSAWRWRSPARPQGEARPRDHLPRGQGSDEEPPQWHRLLWTRFSPRRSNYVDSVSGTHMRRGSRDFDEPGGSSGRPQTPQRDP